MQWSSFSTGIKYLFSLRRGEYMKFVHYKGSLVMKQHENCRCLSVSFCVCFFFKQTAQTGIESNWQCCFKEFPKFVALLKNTILRLPSKKPHLFPFHTQHLLILTIYYCLNFGGWRYRPCLLEGRFPRWYGSWELDVLSFGRILVFPLIYKYNLTSSKHDSVISATDPIIRSSEIRIFAKRRGTFRACLFFSYVSIDEKLLFLVTWCPFVHWTGLAKSRTLCDFRRPEFEIIGVEIRCEG